jgi:sulfoxide reductase heme-binding subunit YedZ
MRRLGARWKSLHRLVHLIVVLSLVHFFLHKMGKNDYREVWVYASAFAAVALLKAWPRRSQALR